MDPADQSKTRGPVPDTMDLVAQTRSLRRKLVFWRRVAWLLLGGIVMVAAVVWNRGESHRRVCYQALETLDKLARDTKLSEQRPEILEEQWRSFDSGSTAIPSYHYDLIVHNWQANPRPGESLPLAVCRESHTTLFSQNRHVLYRDTSGDRIEWIDEKEAAQIAQEAARDNRAP